MTIPHIFSPVLQTGRDDYVMIGYSAACALISAETWRMARAS
jgi:hypothetical protein